MTHCFGQGIFMFSSTRTMVLVFILFAIFYGFGWVDGKAETETKIGELSKIQKKDLDRIESYLEEIVTLRANFVQVSSNGEVSNGMFFLKKPGFFRFQYSPPSQILIIADGTFLSYIDHEIDEIRHMFLSSTPLGFLANEKAMFT